MFNKDYETIPYMFYGNKYNLSFDIGKYQNNDRLYIGLISMGEPLEPFSDLTINIPTYMLEDESEIIISDDVNDDLLEILKNMGIIEYTYKIACSGFGRYKVVRFNESKANKYIYYKEV